MKRLVILAAVVTGAAAIGVIAYLALRGDGADGGSVTRAPITVAVSRGEIQQTVIAPGRVVGTREVMLGLMVGGRLEAVNVRAGSPVRGGYELARLETGPLEEALKDAQQEFVMQSSQGGPASPSGVRRAEADLAAASLIAPFDGVVLEVLAVPGQSVPPDAGLILLADPSAVEVRTTVIEEDLPLVRAGQPVELFFDAHPDVAVESRVVRIVPRRIPGENRPRYHVYISLEHPPQGILSGMTADASIIVARETGVLRLPRAVVRAPSGTSTRVKVLVDGRIESRTVRVGLRGDVHVEALEGLTEDEQVVAE